MKIEKLRESDKSNFSTLLKAAANNALALVSTVRKMVEGNPYELFEDPTQ